VRTHRFVLAAADLYPGGPKVPSVRAEPFEGNPVKMQQLGGPKLEPPLRVGEIFDQFNDRIELFQAVPGFYSRSFVGVGNQLGIESLAMPVLFLDHSSALPATPPLDRLFRG